MHSLIDDYAQNTAQPRNWGWRFLANNRFNSYVPNLSRFFLSWSSALCVCVEPFSLGSHFVKFPSSFSRVEIMTPSSS
jgi:hypothetical protein